MKEIPLTQGRVALVDDSDYEWLNQWKWFACNETRTFYAVRNNSVLDGGHRGLMRMHRLILGLKRGDGRDADHINGNGLDNRRCNLRVCTRAQNNQNRSKSVACSSRYKGVCWYGQTAKWAAHIKHNRKMLHLGYYGSEIEAACTYDVKAKELFGEFAKTNF